MIMDKKLFDVINENTNNYLMPFFWQHGDHTDKIPEQIQDQKTAQDTAKIL